MKIAAITILCIIFFVQFCIALGAVAKRKLGCMESLVVLAYTVLMYSLLFMASCS